MSVFPPPPAPAVWERTVRQAIAEAEAWQAQFPPLAPKPPRPRRENLRRARAKATSVPPAVVNGSDPDADERAAMDHAIYGSKGP